MEKCKYCDENNLCTKCVDPVFKCRVVTGYNCSCYEKSDCVLKHEEKNKLMWDEAFELINADKFCDKCGRKIYGHEQRYTGIDNTNQKVIFHCLSCGPIKIRRKKVMPKNNVDHPSHYTDGKIEVIDFIEDKKLNYHRGNAIKYISRAGKKDKKKEIEDLQKAVWYLNREIERLKQAN